MQAQGRIVLEKELIDGRSGAGFESSKQLPSTTAAQGMQTLKRTFKRMRPKLSAKKFAAKKCLYAAALDDKVLRGFAAHQNQAKLEVRKANEAASSKPNEAS